ncbi:MAG: hypothetical protein ACKO69_02005, partial [Limnohabitans sp.]
QKYHPDRHPDKKLLYTEIMAELNRAHAVLGNVRKRKEFDAAWRKFTEKQKRADEPSTPSPPEDEDPPVKPAGKHDTVLSNLASNKVDEIQMMHLYEELFGNPLTIQHGWTNYYVYKHNGKETRYSFTELKNLIIEKLIAS